MTVYSGLPWQQQGYQQMPWQTTNDVTPMDVYDNSGQNYTNSGFGSLGDWVGGGLGIYNQMRGGTLNTRPMQNIAADIQGLASASYDPNNPIYKNIYSQEKQQIGQDLAESINEAMRQNRKAAAMGRVPLFNPERAGEQAFRAMTSGHANAQMAARQRALDIITGGINAKQKALSAAETAAKAAQLKKKNKMIGMTNLATAIPKILSLL